MPDPADTVTVTPPNPDQPPPSEPAAPVVPPATPEQPPAPAAGNDAPPPANSEKPAFDSLLAKDDKPVGEESQEGGEKGKPDEAAGAPDFDIKLPDGFVPDEAAVGFLKDKVKAGALTGEQAQEMADMHTAAIQRMKEAEFANGQKTIQGWHDEIKANPDFGGAKFNESIEHGRLMLQKYGSPRLVKEFADMGVLDHPEFMYMLNRLHAEVSDGQSHGGSHVASPERDSAKILFPDLD